tara:strand:+ start:5235 stop:5435 length:201 start_codon:yes stop_codon:yes gene_type:complete
VYIIITKTINKNEFSSKFFSKKEIKNIIKVEAIDDKEEYLVIKMINNQDAQKIKPSFKDKAKIIPK